MKKTPVSLPGTPKLERNPHTLLRTALIVVVYLVSFILLDYVSQQFEGLKGIVVWYPPVGLTYALLLVFGVKFTPAVTVALLISSMFIYQMPQAPYLLILWALIVSLVYAATAAFLRKRIHIDWQLRKLRDVVWFICTALLVSALLAVLSVSGSAFDGSLTQGEVLQAMFYWWVGETVGILTVAPFLLIHVMPWLKRFADGAPVRLPVKRPFRRPTLIAIGQAVSIALTIVLALGVRAPEQYQPLYLIALPIIWIALQRGFKAASAAILVLNFGIVLALWLFRFDLARLDELELLMIVNCIVGLLLGAVVTERTQAEKLQEAVYQIAQAADQAVSLDVLFPAIHAIIKSVMPANNYYIALYDEQNDLLSFPYSVDQVDPFLPLGKPGKGLTEYVLRTGRSMLCDDALFEELIKSGEVELVGLSSSIWLGVPLIIAGKAIGVMAVQDYENPRAFSEREQHILEFVSSQVALAIERKQAEQELLSTKAFLNNVINAIADPIFVKDDKRRFVLVNEALCAIVGRPRESLLGEDGDDMFPQDQVAVFRKMDADVLDTGEENENEESVSNLSSEEVHTIITRKTRYIDPAGKRFLVGVIRDITERKQAETEIKNQLVELQRWQGVMLGRESRILEIKGEVNELLGKTGQPPRYASAELPDLQEK